MSLHAEPRGPGPERPRSRRSLQALAASLLLHLLVVLAAFWLPFEYARDPPEEPVEVVFLDLEPPVLQQPALVPQPRAAVPTPRQEPSSPPARAVPDPAEAAAPRLDPAAGQPADQEQRTEEAMREAAAAIDPADYLEQARRSGERAPSGQAGEQGPATAAPDARRLDLDRALREFGRGKTPAPPANPAPAGRSGKAGGTSDLPTSGFGMGELTFESSDFDWNDYGRQIYTLIWRAWHWRLYHTTNEFDRWAFATGRWYLNHSLRIRFVIERSGDVTGVVLEASSGCGPLDRSAADALTEVTLPPLPASFPREREVVHARFIATGDIRDMRPTLTWLYQTGQIP